MNVEAMAARLRNWGSAPITGLVEPAKDWEDPRRCVYQSERLQRESLVVTKGCGSNGEGPAGPPRKTVVALPSRFRFDIASVSKKR